MNLKFIWKINGFHLNEILYNCSRSIMSIIVTMSKNKKIPECSIKMFSQELE